MLSAFKNFAVTLIIALVIFGLGAYFAFGFLTSTMNSLLTSEKEKLEHIVNKDDNDPSGSEEDPVIPVNPDEVIEGESFSFLLVITDYRPELYGDYMPGDIQLLSSQAEEKENDKKNPYEDLGYLSSDYRESTAAAIVLVCADKENEQYTYTYFSPAGRMYTPAGYHTLGEAYSYYGIDVLTEHIHALTGVMPTYRMTVNGYNLDEVVDLLGSVTVTLSRDIYFDGTTYTTEHEHTRDAVDEDGEEYIEHIPNTFVMGAGGVILDNENIGVLAAVKERSMADINMKEEYILDAVRQYLAKLADMEEENLQIVVSMLTLNEADWISIEGVGEETESGESDTDEIYVPPSEDNPWWSAESGVAPAETEEAPESAETSDSETEGETEEPEETVYLFEPETPILETGFTAAELEKIGGVLQAIELFDDTTVSYPGKYVNATKDHGAYFEFDTKNGLKKFLALR